jgi:hypothetical protein
MPPKKNHALDTESHPIHPTQEDAQTIPYVSQSRRTWSPICDVVITGAPGLDKNSRLSLQHSPMMHARCSHRTPDKNGVAHSGLGANPALIQRTKATVTRLR